MQTLNPKIEELKAKYKDNPQKMQAETAALYKKEGINPMSGCLPMLIQMPIFFALYGLLNNHFELRGAEFIAGWINDLASPESIISFYPLKLPILGWSDLRLLPFLMLGATFLQQKISQNPSAGAGQMKMLMLALPLVFFFVLYEMPSGLVLYWTVQNFLSVFQQIYINYTQKKNKGNAIVPKIKK
jgi:YidC/Oxa1 family membrane protein insertase